MMRMRTEKSAAVSPIILVGVIVVLAVLLTAAVLLPYLNRADDWANDPNDPPDEVDLEEGEDPSPDWMGKFELKIDVTYYSFGGVRDIALKNAKSDLKAYDGEPWEASLFSADSFLKPDSLKVKYEIVLTKGNVRFGEEASFKVYGDDNYKGTGETGWFFWWEELEGNWLMTVKFTCGGTSRTFSGAAGLLDGEMVVNI